MMEYPLDTRSKMATNRTLDRQYMMSAGEGKTSFQINIMTFFMGIDTKDFLVGVGNTQ